MKLRNVSATALHVPEFGADVEPDGVVDVPEHVAARIEAGEQLIDLSTWAVVEGDVPPAPLPPEPDVVPPQNDDE